MSASSWFPLLWRLSLCLSTCVVAATSSTSDTKQQDVVVQDAGQLSETDRYRAMFKLFQEAEWCFLNALRRDSQAPSMGDDGRTWPVDESDAAPQFPVPLPTTFDAYCEYYRAEFDPAIDDIWSDLNVPSHLLNKRTQLDVNGPESSTVRARLSEAFYADVAGADADRRCTLLRTLFTDLGLRSHAVGPVLDRCRPYLVADLRQLVLQRSPRARTYLRDVLPPGLQYDADLIGAVRASFPQSLPETVAAVLLLLEPDQGWFQRRTMHWVSSRFLQISVPMSSISVRVGDLLKGFEERLNDRDPTMMSDDEDRQILQRTALFISVQGQSSSLQRLLRILFHPHLRQLDDYPELLRHLTPVVVVAVRGFLDRTEHEALLATVMLELLRAQCHFDTAAEQEAFMALVEDVLSWLKPSVEERFAQFEADCNLHDVPGDFEQGTESTGLVLLRFDVVGAGLHDHELSELLRLVTGFLDADTSGAMADLADFAARRHRTVEVVASMNQWMRSRPPVSRPASLALLRFSPASVFADAAVLDEVVAALRYCLDADPPVAQILDRFPFDLVHTAMRSLLEGRDGDAAVAIFDKVARTWVESDERQRLHVLALGQFYPQPYWTDYSELTVRLLERLGWVQWLALIPESADQAAFHSRLMLLACLHGERTYVRTEDAALVLDLDPGPFGVADSSCYGTCLWEKFFEAALFLVECHVNDRRTWTRTSFYWGWVLSVQDPALLSYFLVRFMDGCGTPGHRTGSRRRLCLDLVEVRASLCPLDTVRALCAPTLPNDLATTLLERVLHVRYGAAPDTRDLFPFVLALWEESSPDPDRDVVIEAVLSEFPFRMGPASARQRSLPVLEINADREWPSSLVTGLNDWVAQIDVAETREHRAQIVEILSRCATIAKGQFSDTDARDPDVDWIGVGAGGGSREFLYRSWRAIFMHLIGLLESNEDQEPGRSTLRAPGQMCDESESEAFRRWRKLARDVVAHENRFRLFHVLQSPFRGLRRSAHTT